MAMVSVLKAATHTSELVGN